jgi:hypothetical protein
VCYCVVFKLAGVVIILTMSAPLTVDSSPCLYSCVVDRSVYVDIIVLMQHDAKIQYSCHTYVRVIKVR